MKRTLLKGIILTHCLVFSGFVMATAPVSEPYSNKQMPNMLNDDSNVALQMHDANMPNTNMQAQINHNAPIRGQVNTPQQNQRKMSGPMQQIMQTAFNTGKMQSSDMSIDSRLSRLESQRANRADLLAQVDGLQQEIQSLRGQLEVQAHDISRMNHRERSFSEDVDIRLAQVEGKGASIDSSVPVKQTAVVGSSAKSIYPVAAKSKTPLIHVTLPSQQASVSAQQTEQALNEQDNYIAAFNYLQVRDYPTAITGFNTYLKNYPHGRYSANAHYWLGEVYLLQKNYSNAEREFDVVINNYPGKSKVDDAMLKLGYVYYDKGEFDQAKNQFTKVKQAYPGTSVARLAMSRLQEIADQNAV